MPPRLAMTTGSTPSSSGPNMSQPGLQLCWQQACPRPAAGSAPLLGAGAQQHWPAAHASSSDRPSQTSVSGSWSPTDRGLAHPQAEVWPEQPSATCLSRGQCRCDLPAAFSAVFAEASAEVQVFAGQVLASGSLPSVLCKVPPCAGEVGHSGGGEPRIDTEGLVVS